MSRVSAGLAPLRRFPSPQSCFALAAVLVFPALTLSGGCSRRAKYARPTVPAAVEVRLDGTPLKAATVTFAPREKGHAAYARTGDDGKARLTTFTAGDGAVVDSYSVTVSCEEFTANPAANLPDPKEKEAHRAAVERAVASGVTPYVCREILPKRYTEHASSGLTADVAADGKNLFVFELSSAPSTPAPKQ